MWERAARHNPLSLTNFYYLDHRPFLPQDPTLNHWWRSQHSQYQQFIVSLVTKGGNRSLFLNNLQVADRERAKILLSQYEHLKACIKPIAFILGLFGSSAFIKFFGGASYKIMYPMGLYAGYIISKGFLINALNRYHQVNFLYYFQKYEHLTVNSIENIKDPRRNYFKVDTSVYYRESADDIRGHGHHGDHEHHDHDTSTYYGPYPVSFCLKLVR
jgi:hypothetical protein